MKTGTQANEPDQIDCSANANQVYIYVILYVQVINYSSLVRADERFNLFHQYQIILQ